MPKIGKNVLENLTQGMYKDSLIIYREYIQNAADQIDKAQANNAFPGEELEIRIDTDDRARRIVIEDNANGIPMAEVERRLADVADSEKVQGEEKGFRGIGRLGGLAYCKELRFVTTYAGEAQQTTMIWDAERLEKILNDRSDHSSAEEILDRIIRYEHEPCDETAHFFRVELIDVRESNDRLSDVEKVRDYISEVAPLDYGETFDTLAHKIYAFADDNEDQSPPPREERTLRLHQYKILVNGEQLYRPYSTYIYKTKDGKKVQFDELRDIQIDLIKTLEGEVVAWIWYGISCFKETMRGKPYGGLVGLRLRQFNIEIGDDHTLDKFFKEQRGNGYFIGEVHTLLPDLIPNARRDYFVENDALTKFEEALEEYVKNHLDKLYHDGSTINSSFNNIAKYDELKDKYDQKQAKGFTSRAEEEKLRAAVEDAQKRAEEAEKKIKRLIERAEQSQSSPLNKMVKLVLRDRNRDQTQFERQPDRPSDIEHKKKPKPKFMVDELSTLKKDERKLVSLIYEIIRENLPPKSNEELIEKIHTALKEKR